MRFKPYHYAHIEDFIRYYAKQTNSTKVIEILDNGISTRDDAKTFCDFIPVLLDQRLADDKPGKTTPIAFGSAIIFDLHYEASSFVCDADFESLWDEMIESL